jgi:hypothetical protein
MKQGCIACPASLCCHVKQPEWVYYCRHHKISLLQCCVPMPRGVERYPIMRMFYEHKVTTYAIKYKCHRASPWTLSHCAFLTCWFQRHLGNSCPVDTAHRSKS